MKKLIVSVLTVGALAAGGAASAQDVLGGLGNVLPQILGNVGLGNLGNVYPGVPGSVYPGQAGQPLTGSVVLDDRGRPKVIAASGYEAMPGGSVVDSVDGGGQVTLDAWGTYIDRFGRRVQVDKTGYHMPITGGPIVAQQRQYERDRDRDGVPDAYDRYPRDRRYR